MLAPYAVWLIIGFLIAGACFAFVRGVLWLARHLKDGV